MQAPRCSRRRADVAVKDGKIAAIGAVSDAFGHIEYGFALATGFAALLFIGSLLNWLLNPTRAVLERLDVTEYRQDATA